MKNYIKILLFVTIPMIFQGQESNIYTNNGILKVDTSFMIEVERVEDFKIIEKYGLPRIFNALVYSDLIIENGACGIFIIKISLKSNNINYRIVKSNNKLLNESIINSLIKTEKYLLYMTAGMELPFEFYIPIKYEFCKDTFKDDLKANKAITIKGSSTTKISTYYNNKYNK